MAKQSPVSLSFLSGISEETALDHGECLELNVLQGPVRDVRHLAERGVRHSRVVMIPAEFARERHAHEGELRRSQPKNGMCWSRTASGKTARCALLNPLNPLSCILVRPLLAHPGPTCVAGNVRNLGAKRTLVAGAACDPCHPVNYSLLHANWLV